MKNMKYGYYALLADRSTLKANKKLVNKLVDAGFMKRKIEHETFIDIALTPYDVEYNKGPQTGSITPYGVSIAMPKTQAGDVKISSQWLPVDLSKSKIHWSYTDTAGNVAEGYANDHGNYSYNLHEDRTPSVIQLEIPFPETKD